MKRISSRLALRFLRANRDEMAVAAFICWKDQLIRRDRRDQSNITDGYLEYLDANGDAYADVSWEELLALVEAGERERWREGER